MRQKICIFAQNAGMSLSMTLTLCFLASVCPPHVRLHGGPSASPCLMPFSGEQRVFLYESPDPQLSCNAECGICFAAAPVLPPFSEHSPVLTLQVLLRGSSPPQHFGKVFKPEEEGSSPRQITVLISYKLLVFHH